MPSFIAKRLLHPYQYRIRSDTSRFRASVLPRQSGKDFMHMEEAVALAQCNPKTDVLIAAPGERQALETLDKAKDWAEVYSLPIEGYAEERERPQALLKAKTITFPNRSRIIAVPGIPDLVRGYCAHTFITEFDFLEDARDTFQALLPSISNESKGIKCCRIYSTPITKAGLFYEIVDKNLLNIPPGFVPDWSVHHMNIYQCMAEGLKLDIEKIKRIMNDDERFAQEFMCEFRDSSNVLLPYDLIKLAESSEASSIMDPDFFRLPQQWPTFCGVDFGRTHDPTVCWTLQRVGQLLITKEVLVLRNMPMDQQWEILKMRFRGSSKTSLDYTGLGIGIGDTAIGTPGLGLHDPGSHKFGKIEPITFTPKTKRMLFPHLRRAFEAPTILRIPEDKDIREDLHAMQQVVTNGEYDYYAPRTKDGHSDRCTALALAVRAAESGAGLAQKFVPVGSATKFGQAMGDRRDRRMSG
jgi:phage FluMu gp28-like protein